ncbi:MAG TPA: winged helix-turn-helix domain-containing protein [Burkholderiaceae bacterium]|nr:winged helix-turn-helix domain-containing protein [Burkholderiaceae bacterium]
MLCAVYGNENRLVALLHQCFGLPHLEVEVFHEELRLLRAVQRRSYDFILVTGTKPASLFSWHASTHGPRAPIIVLVNAPNHDAMIPYFEAGADDVMIEPVSPRELEIRINMAIRRSALDRSTAARINIGPYCLDRVSGHATVNDHHIHLTPREFATAWLLFSNVGKCVARDKLAHAIWGAEIDVATRTIEQHIYKLRKKLHMAGQMGVTLRTVYSRGYKLEVNADYELPKPQPSMPVRMPAQPYLVVPAA